MLTILTFLVLFYNSCNFTQNIEAKKNISEVKLNGGINTEEQVDTFRLGYQLSYKEVVINKCKDNEIVANPIYRSTINLPRIDSDSVSISHNDTVFYCGRLINTLYSIVLFYDEKHNKHPSLPGFLRIDTTIVNEFKIRYIEKNAYLKFRMLKYSREITIIDGKPKWKIVYTNCRRLIYE